MLGSCIATTNHSGTQARASPIARPYRRPQPVRVGPELQGLLRVWEGEFVGLRIQGPLFGYLTLKLNQKLLSRIKYTIGLQFVTYFFVALKYIATYTRGRWFNKCGEHGDDFWP